MPWTRMRCFFAVGHNGQNRSVADCWSKESSLRLTAEHYLAPSRLPWLLGQPFLRDNSHERECEVGRALVRMCAGRDARLRQGNVSIGKVKWLESINSAYVFLGAGVRSPFHSRVQSESGVVTCSLTAKPTPLIVSSTRLQISLSSSSPDMSTGQYIIIPGKYRPYLHYL